MYHLFAGQKYYPRGGAEDYVSSADTMDQLLVDLRGFFAAKIGEGAAYGCSGLWAHICDNRLRVIREYSAPDNAARGEWTNEPEIRAVRELIQEELDRLVRRLLTEKW